MSTWRLSNHIELSLPCAKMGTWSVIVIHTTAMFSFMEHSRPLCQRKKKIPFANAEAFGSYAAHYSSSAVQMNSQGVSAGSAPDKSCRGLSSCLSTPNAGPKRSGIYRHKHQVKYFYPLSYLTIIPSPTMASLEKCARLSFQQAMELPRLPDQESGTGSVMLRFMNRQPPWATGDALPWETSGIPRPPGTKVAFGGVVYAQAPLAAARAIASRADSSSDKDRAFGIHVRKGPRYLLERFHAYSPCYSPSMQSSRAPGLSTAPSSLTCLKPNMDGHSRLFLLMSGSPLSPPLRRLAHSPSRTVKSPFLPHA